MKKITISLILPNLEENEEVNILAEISLLLKQKNYVVNATTRVWGIWALWIQKLPEMPVEPSTPEPKTKTRKKAKKRNTTNN